MATPEEIAQQLVDDFNDRTYAQNAARYFAPDCVNVDLPTGQELYGIEGAIQSTDVWVQAFPDAYAEVVSHDVQGNTVTTTIRASGTFDGQMMLPDGTVIPGSGQPLEMEYRQTITVEDGMVVRVEASYDMQNMLSQLGLG
jgi:predicted ester cyclase